MNSGLTLLTESDEAVIASEFLLQENDLKPAEKEKEAFKLKDVSVTAAAKPKTPEKTSRKEKNGSGNTLG